MRDFKIGSATPSDIRIGTAGVSAVYCGSVLVWPCDRPPYNCRTDVNTFCVTDFTEAWDGCTELTIFPQLDTSSGVIFKNAWSFCWGLTSFPLIDTSNGVNFDSAWANCSGLISFPSVDFSSGLYFDSAWNGCTSLVDFPPNMFDTCAATQFTYAWSGCALSQSSVDNILVSLDVAGQSNGRVNIDFGTSSPPGPAGLAAKAALQAKYWYVFTN